MNITKQLMSLINTEITKKENKDLLKNNINYISDIFYEEIKYYILIFGIIVLIIIILLISNFIISFSNNLKLTKLRIKSS